MECLVDDTVNSNIISSPCPQCDWQPSSPTPSLNSPRELLATCRNCRHHQNANNPVLQTHHDLVPLSELARPRCCSCLAITPHSLVGAETPELCLCLNLQSHRPRSGSTPTPSVGLVRESDLLSQTCPSLAAECLDTSTINLSRQPLSSVQRSPLGVSGNSSESSLDQFLTPASSPQDLTESCDQKTEANKRQSNSEGETIRDRNGAVCLRCGHTRHCQLDKQNTPGDLCNINVLHTQPVAELSSGDILQQHADSSLQGQSTNSLSLVPKDESDSRVTLENKHTSQPPDATTLYNPSPEELCSESPIDGIQSETGTKVLNTNDSNSPFSCLTSSQKLIHNLEHNRATTVGGWRTLPSPRSSRVHTRLVGSQTRGLSKSMQTRHGIPHILEPDSPLSILPSDVMHELHNLFQESEDLSAEVVYSLHFRDYQIKDLLGKGISSTVRRVTEKSSSCEYAVKIIDISGEKGELNQVEQIKKDTFREIQILRLCAGHSHIIELHDVFETPTFIFLVFEICRKGELFDYLTSVVSLSEKRTRTFMRQLFEAVAFIHDKNIVHRDLKPENILLDDNLNIKVSDFGFATVVEEGEELTELCGTPGYLAPEVLAHSMYENVSGYGKEVDMWACGVIMYTLLCGAPPFWNRRQMMMLRAIMNADYTFNSPEWDDISESPKNLIRKLLVVNPKDRLTAREALKHDFFHSQEITEVKKFLARRKFRAAANCIMFYQRLSFHYKHPPPISVETVRTNPYSIKLMRKVIDTCAFGMYKHWVKRVDNQNRAALFEHTLRDDWRHNPMTVDSIYLL